MSTPEALLGGGVRAGQAGWSSTMRGGDVTLQVGSFKGMGTLFPHGDYYLHYNRSQKIRRCLRHLITRRPHLHASEVDTFLSTGFQIAPHK